MWHLVGLGIAKQTDAMYTQQWVNDLLMLTHSAQSKGERKNNKINVISVQLEKTLIKDDYIAKILAECCLLSWVKYHFGWFVVVVYKSGPFLSIMLLGVILDCRCGCAYVCDENEFKISVIGLRYIFKKNFFYIIHPWVNGHFSVNFDHFIPIWNENCITPRTLCIIQINFEPIFIPFWNKIYKFHYKTEKCQSGGIQHKFIPILEWSDYYYFSLKEKKMLKIRTRISCVLYCWKFERVCVSVWRKKVWMLLWKNT